jgi:hypothetical protein
LLQGWLEQASRVNSVQGLAKIQVQAPLNNVNGTQVILAEMPDRVRAEMLSPFGAPILMLAVDGDQFGVLLPSQNLFYTGYATPKNLGMFVNIPLQPADLVAVLLYQPQLIEAWKEEAFTLKDGGWLLIRYGTMKRQELVFNTARQLVEVSYFEESDLKLKASYDQIEHDKKLFPAQITMKIPEKYATVTLEFTDFETNGRMKEGIFVLQPPPGAEIVHMPN